MRRRDEAGAAVLTGLLLAGVLVFVAVACGLAVAAVAGHRQAQNGADLASLAAARAVQTGASPCEVASEFADANRVELTACAQSGEAVAVTVVVKLAVGPLAVSLPAGARAGPG